MTMTSKELRLFLRSNIDPVYQSFSASLLPGVSDVWGIRLPVLRLAAKKIVKEETIDLLKKTMKNPCFEERMTLGMAIGYLPWDANFLEDQVKPFLSWIDNWSICDSFCSGLKGVSLNRDETWRFIKPYFKSNLEYEVRFATVLSLQYFLTDKYLLTVLSQLALVKQKGYYAKMAVAWAISKAYVVSPLITKDWLCKTHLDPVILKKALQKIRESNCVSKGEAVALQASVASAKALL